MTDDCDFEYCKIKTNEEIEKSEFLMVFHHLAQINAH